MPQFERIAARHQVWEVRAGAGPHPQTDVGQTFCWMVPPGLRLTVTFVTNLPVAAERLTVRVLPVPEPTRSVVVVAGDRFTVALDTNRPVPAERFTERGMFSPFPSTFPGLIDLLVVIGDGAWSR